jgi:hypothetical protein
MNSELVILSSYLFGGVVVCSLVYVFTDAYSILYKEMNPAPFFASILWPLVVAVAITYLIGKLWVSGLKKIRARVKSSAWRKRNAEAWRTFNRAA